MLPYVSVPGISRPGEFNPGRLIDILSSGLIFATGSAAAQWTAGDPVLNWESGAVQVSVNA